VEPFLGGGSVFFHLRPKKALLSDSNAQLINTYQQVRETPTAIYHALLNHHQNHNAEYYYQQRQIAYQRPHERAAQFIYLNRVCWNGLYRVNTRGEFNVPLGTKTAVVLPTDDFILSSSRLGCATIVAADFEETLAGTKDGDFVFIDPPYVTRHNFNGFVKYNHKIFRWTDQERLCAAVMEASRRQVKFLITNADHGSIRCLYRGIGRHITLTRHSKLAADATNRSTITEIAIAINYDPEST
jgi:DNA adenine methylase